MLWVLKYQQNYSARCLKDHQIQKMVLWVLCAIPDTKCLILDNSVLVARVEISADVMDQQVLVGVYGNKEHA